MDDELPEGIASELMLVLEGDLYLVPFPVLKGSNCTEYLCERFSLLSSLSLTQIKTKQHRNVKSTIYNDRKWLVVGNPKLPTSVTEQWGWDDIPHSEAEANIVSEILGTKSLLGSQATKDALLTKMKDAEAIHLACHVSWKLSAVVFSPSEIMESTKSTNGMNNMSCNPRRLKQY